MDELSGDNMHAVHDVDPMDLITPATYANLDTLPEFIEPYFVNVTHLSIGASFLRRHEDFVTNTICFPSLVSFTGPLSAFVALSHHHPSLRDVVLLQNTGSSYLSPSWVNMWDEEDLTNFLAALQRVNCRSLVVGLTWSSVCERAGRFWNELARATPHLEALGLLATNCGDEIYRQYTKTANIEGLARWKHLRRVRLHLSVTDFSFKWSPGATHWDIPVDRIDSQPPTDRRQNDRWVSSVKASWTKTIRHPECKWDTFYVRLDSYRGSSAKAWVRHDGRGMWRQRDELTWQAYAGNMFAQACSWTSQ